MFSRGLKGDMILGNTLTNLLISKFVFKQMPYIAKFTIFCDFLGPYTIIQFVHYIVPCIFIFNKIFWLLIFSNYTLCGFIDLLTCIYLGFHLIFLWSELWGQFSRGSGQHPDSHLCRVLHPLTAPGHAVL